jgi:hypothetical protein
LNSPRHAPYISHPSTTCSCLCTAPYLSPPFLLAFAISKSTFSSTNTPTVLSSSHTSYHLPMKMEQIRVFQNVGIYNSEAGELPKRKHNIFRTRRKFEIKKSACVSCDATLSCLWIWRVW